MLKVTQQVGGKTGNETQAPEHIVHCPVYWSMLSQPNVLINWVNPLLKV